MPESLIAIRNIGRWPISIMLAEILTIPSEVNLIALPTRFVTTCLKRTSSVSIRVGKSLSNSTRSPIPLSSARTRKILVTSSTILNGE